MGDPKKLTIWVIAMAVLVMATASIISMVISSNQEEKGVAEIAVGEAEALRLSPGEEEIIELEEEGTCLRWTLTRINLSRLEISFKTGGIWYVMNSEAKYRFLDTGLELSNIEAWRFENKSADEAELTTEWFPEYSPGICRNY